MQEKNTVQNKT